MGGCNVVATGHGRYSSVLCAETVSSTGSVSYVGSFVVKFYCC